MADVGEELLDGDLDESAFDDLDAEQEDALLADDEFESYQDSQMIYRKTTHSGDSHREVYQVIEQVHDDEEILEDGVEDDVLDIAVVDELDENELESQETEGWTDNSSRTNEDSCKDSSDTVGVSSSTHGFISRGGEGESDEEDTEGRGSRFRSERTNVISLKGAIGSKNLNDIPDSLDNVRTPMNNGRGMQHRGRGMRGGVRGRLGQRGGMMGRGGPRHRPPMMHQPQMPPPGHKIHLNPHFRGGGMHHGGPNVWDNDRLPPPPGCENFPPPMGHPHNQDMGWRGPMGPPHHMGPPHPHPHPGPRGPFPGPQGFPPHHPQGYEEQYHSADHPQQNPSNRIVQFNENSQLVTVENQHFQGPGYDQNYGPPNQFQPPAPQFNNNMYPPQYNQQPRPNFPQNHYPGPNQNQPNYTGYHQPDYQQNSQYQNYEEWNPQQSGEYYPPGQPQAPASFNHPQPQFRHPQPSFPNQPPNFRPPQQFQNRPRMSVMKRVAPRPPINSAPKQMRFDHNKPAVNTRSNLQEIKTVDSLPDTTTKQDMEPEIEEDEETKAYRLKIAEQKALREKILREKEARRLAAALEKQKQQNHSENNSNSVPTPVQPTVPTPVQVQQTSVQQQPVQRVQQQQPVQRLQQQPVQRLQQQPVQRMQQQQPVQRMQQQIVRGMGRGRGQSVNKVLQPGVRIRQAAKANQKVPVNQTKLPNKPQVQIQNIQGTMYKIVKVTTKEGSIVTRKTPMTTNEAALATSLTRTVANLTKGVTVNANRKVVLNINNQAKTGTNSILRGTTVPRMVPTKNAQGRLLYTVQTTPNATMPKTTPQRLVIDNRPTNPLKVVKPELPDSSLVSIDNLSLSTTQAHIQKMAKQVGTLTSFTYEPEKKKATLRFQKVQEAKEFHNKFNRKMIDLSRILVTVVPE